MRVFTGIGAAALLAALSTVSLAQPVQTRVTARALNGVCTESRPACLTYVLGVADAFASVAAGRVPFCPPNGTTNEQMTQVAVRYIRAHPEVAEANAASVVLAALRETYPCGY